MTDFLVQLGLLRRREGKGIYASVTAVYRYIVYHTFRVSSEITYCYISIDNTPTYIRRFSCYNIKTLYISRCCSCFLGI